LAADQQGQGEGKDYQQTQAGLLDQLAQREIEASKETCPAGGQEPFV
jgi:hypothetical protein